MSLRHHLGVVSLGIKMGLKQSWSCKIEVLGSIIIYATVIVVWGGIIKMLPLDLLESLNLTTAGMIWYIGATEFVVFVCPSWGFKQVQNDLETGQAHLGLLRPYPDSLLRISMWTGDALVRTAAMLLPFLLVCWGLSGEIYLSVEKVLLLLSVLPMAIGIMLAGAYMVGGSCLWLIQAEPAFWVWQKSVYILGAMVWPMAFYPEVMQKLMWLTPFPSLLAVAGDWVMAGDLIMLGVHLLHQLFWGVVFIALLRWFDAAVLRRVQSGVGS